MANIKGQMKRNITNEKRRLANASFRSGLKTAVKAVEAAVAAGNKEEATKALSLAFKKLDKSLNYGYHKNKVARHKSQLAKLVNTL